MVRVCFRYTETTKNDEVRTKLCERSCANELCANTLRLGSFAMVVVDGDETPEYTQQLMAKDVVELFGSLDKHLLKGTGVKVSGVQEGSLIQPILELVSAEVWERHYKKTPSNINRAGFSLWADGEPKLNGVYSEPFGARAGGKGIVVEIPKDATVSVSRNGEGVTSARHSERTAARRDTWTVNRVYEYTTDAKLPDGTVGKLRTVGWLREAFVVIAWTNEPNTGTNTNTGELVLIGGFVSDAQVTYKVRSDLCSPSP